MMNGRSIAMAVCGLMLTAAPTLVQADHHAKDTKEAKVKCKTNKCSGPNGCESMMTEKECKDQKGTVVPDKKPDDKTKAAPAPAPAPAPKK